MSPALTPEPPPPPPSPAPPPSPGSLPGNPPGSAALDELALGRLRELDPDGRHGVLRRVLAAFETSLMRMLLQLTAERVNGDAGVVCTVAHTLKSSSASVGALALSKACGDVERRIRAQLPGDLQAEVEMLLSAGEAALVAVRAMLRP